MPLDLATHAQLAPAAGETTPPIVVRRDDDLGLLALGECGAGGADGEAAVHLVLNAVTKQIEHSRQDLQRQRTAPDDALRARLVQALEEALRQAGQELYVFCRRRGAQLGVGIDLVLWFERELIAAHVGAGGLYLVRRDLLHRLARGRRVRPGVAPLSESRWAVADSEPVLLGRDSLVEVETLCLETWPGDHFALLSGGLAGSLDDADVRTMLACLEPSQAARGLLHMARERGAEGPLGAFLLRAPGEAAAGREGAIGLLPVLGRMPLLAWCTREELLDVAAVARPRRAAAGECIFREGEPGAELFLLVRGEVSVTSAGAGVARLGPGSAFGEMAMLDYPERSATVEALGEVELLVLPREAFFALLKGSTTLAVKLLWNLLIAVSGKLRRTTAVVSGLVAGEHPVEVQEEDSDPTLQVPSPRRSRR